MLTADPDIRRLMALRAIEGGLLRLKWLAAATRFEIAMHRHARALKANFNPNEPRVPRGNPDGGQWTYVPGWSSSNRRNRQSTDDDGGDETTRDSSRTGRIRLAGEIPTGDPPDIPKEKPPTSKERTSIKKTVANWLDRVGGTVEMLVAVAKLNTWLQTYVPEIQSYRDPPKSLEELQQAVSSPGPGYQKHHIVEQTQAEEEGFLREVIDAPDNIVLIPKLKHEEITGWYQTPNPEYNWQTPRDYLSGRNWDVKQAVGLDALKKFGVLKP